MATTAIPKMTTDSPARQGLLFVKRPNEYPPRNSSTRATRFEIRSASRALLTKINRTTTGNSDRNTTRNTHSAASQSSLASRGHTVDSGICASFPLNDSISWAQEQMPPMAATHQQRCALPRPGPTSCVVVREERCHVPSDRESSRDRKTRR